MKCLPLAFSSFFGCLFVLKNNNIKRRKVKLLDGTIKHDIEQTNINLHFIVQQCVTHAAIIKLAVNYVYYSSN